MATKRGVLLSIVPAIASILLAVGVSTVFSACGLKDDGTWMKCHSVQETILWIAVAVTAVLVVAAFVRNGALRTVLHLLCAAASVVMFLIPGTLVPMCMMQTMRCYAVMQPFVRIMSVVLCVMCIATAVRLWRRRASAASKKKQ